MLVFRCRMLAFADAAARHFRATLIFRHAEPLLPLSRAIFRHFFAAFHVSHAATISMSIRHDFFDAAAAAPPFIDAAAFAPAAVAAV